MSLSLEQLMAVARYYWPTPEAREQDSSLEHTPEALRLHELWEQKLKEMERWWATLDDLRNKLSGFTIGDATVPLDACFRCVAYPSEFKSASKPYWGIVGCLSIVAPVYTVYGAQFERHEGRRVFKRLDFEPHRAETKTPAELMARGFEAEFGFSLLSAEHARVQVPLRVKEKNPPETLLFHALFTNEPENLP